MNDGFYGLIGLWCLLILLWSGWFDSFLYRHQINKKVVLLLIPLSFVGGGWTWKFGDGGMLILPYTLPLVLGAYAWIKEGDRYRIHLAAASFLIGASAFLMQLLFRFDPILMIWDEKYILSLLILLLIFVAAKAAMHQFILLAFGLGFSDLCFQLYLWDKMGTFLLGSSLYQDIWLISLYSLIFARCVLRFVKWPSFLKRKRAETTS